ncbi:hypothetical protein J6590_022766 [Homalodisca vitripennis]|nr:hypothetical protein J6590_022766 [Homalodisca vitripennis]
MNKSYQLGEFCYFITLISTRQVLTITISPATGGIGPNKGVRLFQSGGNFIWPISFGHATATARLTGTGIRAENGGAGWRGQISRRGVEHPLQNNQRTPYARTYVHTRQWLLARLHTVLPTVAYKQSIQRCQYNNVEIEFGYIDN